MTFTWVGDLSTNLDKVRSALGDSDSTAALFTDEEINGALGIYTNWMEAAAYLADAQAAKYSRNASISIDGASVQYNQRAAMFLAMATRLRQQAQLSPDNIASPYVGGVSIADMDSQRDNSDREPSRFEVGMMDYPGVSLARSGGADADDDGD